MLMKEGMAGIIQSLIFYKTNNVLKASQISKNEENIEMLIYFCLGDFLRAISQKGHISISLGVCDQN